MDYEVQNNKRNVGRFFKVGSVILSEVKNFKKFQLLSKEEKVSSSIPKEFVNKLLELGPTFIKLGQILSTRPDFLPEQYIKELKVLHDHVPAFSYDKVQEILQKEFSKDVNSIFNSFDQTPIAAASLAQVHFALLPDGSKVAVKIQRPGVKEIIKKDLVVLSWVVRLAKRLFPKLTKNLSLENAFKEFKKYTLRELDFLMEADTLIQFRQNFKEWDDVTFPAVYKDYTTSRVLTMEKMAGMHIDEVKSKISSENRKKLSKRLTELEMKMFITDSFFHADLHPGNIFFKEDGTIAIIDVGMFGKLTDGQRDRFLLYWLAIVEKEKKRAFSHLLKLGEMTATADREGFYSKFAKILDMFYEADLSSRSLTKTYLEIFITGAKFGYRFPSEMLLQAKAMTTAETLVLTMTPNFKFYEEARPIVTRELGQRAEPEQVRKRLKQTLPEWLLFGETVDSDLIFSEDEQAKSDRAWKEIGKIWCEDFDRRKTKDNEVKHGEYAVIVNESLEKVFNFVTRFAQYPFWHPTYTEESKVIHVSGKYVFITPQVTGSVFRLDEIVDGNHLLSNAEVTEFERNKYFKWRAPLSIFPLVDIGTCFTFEDLGDNRTRLYEYFYYIDDPMMNFIVNRKWFSEEALVYHIKEELTGVKNIIETKQYNPEDMDYLWKNLKETTRLQYCDETASPVKIAGIIEPLTVQQRRMA